MVDGRAATDPRQRDWLAETVIAWQSMSLLLGPRWCETIAAADAVDPRTRST